MEVEKRRGAGLGGADPPVIACWDTCTLRGVLAVGAGGRLLAETYFEAARGHATWLMPQLDATLGDLGISASELGYLATGLGPGTFTGVKVGVACAKAVSLGLGVPLVGMPTLDTLARGAPRSARVVLSLLDARRGQLYAAAYRRSEAGLERVTDYMCLEPRRLAGELAPFGFREVTIVGETSRALLEILERSGRVLTGDEAYPRGADLLELAGEKISRGEVSDAVSVAPIYLKKPT